MFNAGISIRVGKQALMQLKKLIGLSLLALPLFAQAEGFGSFYKGEDFHVGVEVNPVTLLASGNDKVFISGGASIFHDEYSAEIAFPVYYKNFQSGDEQFTALALGAQYRKFFNQSTQGYYLSGATQLINVNSSTTKLGVGFGAGYRKVFDSGLYWGAGVVIGRYLGSESNKEYHQLTSIETQENNSYFVDIELLKVGILF